MENWTDDQKREHWDKLLKEWEAIEFAVAQDEKVNFEAATNRQIEIELEMDALPYEIDEIGQVVPKGKS